MSPDCGGSRCQLALQLGQRSHELLARSLFGAARRLAQPREAVATGGPGQPVQRREALRVVGGG